MNHSTVEKYDPIVCCVENGEGHWQYLVGTFRMGDNRMRNITLLLRGILLKCSVFAVEININNDSRMKEVNSDFVTSFKEKC
jgi:hypothetical protein